jgi:hypothetical protein
VHISYINYYFVSILEGQVHFADGKTHSNFRSFLDILKDNDCTHRATPLYNTGSSIPPYGTCEKTTFTSLLQFGSMQLCFPRHKSKALGTWHLPASSPLLSSPPSLLCFNTLFDHPIGSSNNAQTISPQALLLICFFFFFFLVS